MGKNGYTNDFLLDELKRYYDEFNEVPTFKKLDENKNYPGASIYRHRFGSWNNAIKLTGLKVNSKTNCIKDYDGIKNDYLNGMELRDIAKKYGYHDASSICNVINKLEVNKRNNKWTKEQLELLKEKYTYEDWNILLDLLKPFSRQDIHTKASELGLKRNIYFWSKEEIAILLNNYGIKTIKELRLLLPKRTEKAIIKQAKMFGLKTREFWTEQEINLLQELYPYKTTEELLKCFPNRTRNSVLVMARNVLKIPKDKEYLDKQWEENRLSDDEMIKLLKEYAEEIGRTPFQLDLDDNEFMPSSTSYRRHFGTYTEACRLAGLEPNFNIYGEIIHTYLSDNNDICFSKSEQIITNLLFNNNILYVKEYLYKYIIDDIRCGLKRADWFLPEHNIIVEFFGMPEKDFYKIKMLEKIKICKDNNINLIDLYPNDLKNNLEGVKNKLNDIVNMVA